MTVARVCPVDDCSPSLHLPLPVHKLPQKREPFLFEALGCLSAGKR